MSIAVGAVALLSGVRAHSQTGTQFWLQRSSTGAAGILAPDPSVTLPVAGTTAPTMINSVIFDRDHMYYSIGTQAIYVADAASNYIRSYTMFSMGGQLGVAPDPTIGTCIDPAFSAQVRPLKHMS